MGIEERQCEYCKCVPSEYMIAYCNECDKYVCRNNKYPCGFMNVPEMIYDEFKIIEIIFEHYNINDIKQKSNQYDNE